MSRKDLAKRKEYYKKYHSTPENKAKAKARCSTPEFKARRKVTIKNDNIA